MAKLLGEEECSALFHQGKSDNIQLSLVGDRALLTAIFDEQTTVGMVRLYARHAGLVELDFNLDVHRGRQTLAGLSPQQRGTE